MRMIRAAPRIHPVNKMRMDIWVLLLCILILSVLVICNDERRLKWWKIHWGVTFAVVAGLIVIVMGDHLHEYHGTDTFSRIVSAWAPHVGPELVILAFAAVAVEGVIRKAEQRREVRFRTVRGFMYLVDYAHNRSAYFDGGSAYYLTMEKQALIKRSESRRLLLWTDERELYDEAFITAMAFIDEALHFADAVDLLNSERSLLRIELLGKDQAANFWPAIFSLEDNARATLRRMPLAADRPLRLTVDDLLDAGRRRAWDEQTAAVAASAPLLRDRLRTYFKNDWAIMEERALLLNKFAAFQAAAIAFRDRVWASDNPDE